MPIPRAREPKRLPPGLWKRGGVYYARFRHNGRVIRKRVSTDLRVAESMLNDLRARLDKGDFGMLDNDVPWSDAKQQYLSAVKQSLRDVDQVVEDLARFARFRPLKSVKEISPEFVFHYREWRQSQMIGKPPKPSQPDHRRNVGPRTVNREVAVLRSMLARLVEWGLIGSNPIEKVKPLKVDKPRKSRRALERREIDTFFEVLPEYLRPVFYFILTTGCRRNEACSLLWSDVDFERRSVTIRASVAKSGKERTIPLTDEMVAILEAERAEAVVREPVKGSTPNRTKQQLANFSREHCFVSNANTPWGPNLLKRFYLYAQRAGINDARPRGAVDLHSLRGTFVSLAIANGASPKAVQEIVGHSSLDLTMNCYAKASDQSKRNAIAALQIGSTSPPAGVVALP